MRYVYKVRPKNASFDCIRNWQNKSTDVEKENGQEAVCLKAFGHFSFPPLLKNIILIDNFVILFM